MRNLISLITLALVVLSCKKKDYVTFSGTVENKTSDSIVIANPQKGYQKTIKLNEKGVFKDTLKVSKGFFFFNNGKNKTSIYLTNGNDIKVNFDANSFPKSLLFSGKGAAENNFINKTRLDQESFSLGLKDLLELPETEFETKLNGYTSGFKSRLENKDLDTAFVSLQEKSITSLKKKVYIMHEEKQYVKTKLAKGMPSPKFIDYEKIDRETVSLDDLKGKYVYIDMWATWCPPCKAEIPFLQKIETEYHDKNIEFVSISIDSRDDYFTWSDMVEEKSLSGIQLYANEDKSFTTAYRINDIPRFILIDPAGNIVNQDAPRPSDPKLIELFNSLEI